MPTAFMAKSDEASDVAGVWGEVWEDSGSSAAASLRLYMADILPLLIQGTRRYSIKTVLHWPACDLNADELPEGRGLRRPPRLRLSAKLHAVWCDLSMRYAS